MKKVEGLNYEGLHNDSWRCATAIVSERWAGELCDFLELLDRMLAEHDLEVLLAKRGDNVWFDIAKREQSSPHRVEMTPFTEDDWMCFAGANEGAHIGDLQVEDTSDAGWKQFAGTWVIVADSSGVGLYSSCGDGTDIVLIRLSPQESIAESLSFIKDHLKPVMTSSELIIAGFKVEIYTEPSEPINPDDFDGIVMKPFASAVSEWEASEGADGEGYIGEIEVLTCGNDSVWNHMCGMWTVVADASSVSIHHTTHSGNEATLFKPMTLGADIADTLLYIKENLLPTMTFSELMVVGFNVSHYNKDKGVS